MKTNLKPLVGQRGGVPVRSVMRSAGTAALPFVTSRAHSRSSSVPVTTQTVRSGTSDIEHVWVEGAGKDRHGRDRSGPHTQYQGEILLCNVDLSANLDRGSHIPGGTLVLEPSALGGRPAVVDKTYSFHNWRGLELIYVPNCPSTTAGSIGAYYQPDVGIPGLAIEDTEIEHAAQFGDNFIDASVTAPWRKAFTIASMVNEYTNETEDAYLEAQGVITLITTSFLAAGAYGKVYLRYDIEFYGQSDNYECDPVFSSELHFRANALALSSGDAFLLPSGTAAPGGGAGNFYVSVPPPAASYILYGEIEGITGDPPEFFVGDDPAAASFKAGQILFCGLADTDGANNWTTGGIYACLYTDYASADSSPMGPGMPAFDDNDKGLLRVAADGNYTFSLSIRIRAIPTDDRN